ncbi:MAG: DNA replication and repair protein RecF, partial [bacterium]
INGSDVRKFGSRGEHKSVLISSKIAEFKFIKERRQETPIFLLDDYHSELDGSREEKIFYFLDELGQIFLTTSREDDVNLRLRSSIGHKEVSLFYVESGEIEKKST